MRSHYLYPLFLGFLVFPSLLPAATRFDRCPWIAFGSDARDFGTGGQGGKSGNGGSDGRNSDSLTLFLDGSPLKLDLSGQNGVDGEAGTRGTDGKCAGQPEKISRDLHGGGDGGNGGDGGDGGNGGGLTLYAVDPALLKRVTVNAAGGKGGRGGEGGRGGRGCRCQQPFWTIQTCEGKPGDPSYRCSTREFRCRDGLDGASGNGGRPGRDGLPGQLTWIQLDRPLTTDRPSATVPLTELKERGYILSKNSWETRSGAAALFAPGSTVDDRYQLLVARVERSMILIWNAPQSFERFADQRLTLSLDENQDLRVALPPGLWVEGTTQKRERVTEFVVYNAVFERDVTRLQDKGLAGNGSDLRVFLEDGADRSDLVGTKFHVRYRVSRWSGNDPQTSPGTDFVTRYDGQLPPGLVSQRGSRFTLALGRLPLPPEALRAGTGVEIELLATRTFAGYSKEQKLVLRDTIKGMSR